jgi:hypothetical protein
MRSLQITSQIQDRMRSALGDDLPDLSSIKVYEATAISTRPVNKRGTLWDKAVVSRSTMAEMASVLNGGKYVPLHTMHQQGSELPVGRLFYAEVLDDNAGNSELRVLFYIAEDEEELISSIEAGVLENLSIGMKPEKMLCSECEFDYLSDEATFDNLFDRVCANDHRIGENGVHIRAVGLDQWFELSLVSVGASEDATIKSRSKQRFSEEDRKALAASGISPESTILVATHQGDEDMSKEMLERLEAQAGEVATLKAEKASAQTRVTELEAELSSAKEKITELEGKETSEEVTELKASLETAQTEANEAKEASATALELMQEQAKRALVASGQENPEAPETIELCIEAIKEAGVALHQSIPVGGVSTSVTSAGKEASTDFSAFKSRES